MAEKKNLRRLLKNVLDAVFFVAMTGLAVWYIFKSNDDPVKTFETLRSLRALPLILLVVATLGLNVLDGLAMTIFTRLYQPKYHYYQGLTTATIGNFVGVYNRAASTLVQASTLQKQGIQGAHGASIVTMNFLMYQFSLTVYSLLTFILGFSLTKDIPINLLPGVPIIWFCILGLWIDVFMLLFFVFLSFSRRFHRFLLTKGIHVLTKLHLVKDGEETKKKWAVKIATYHIEIRRMFSHQGACVLAFFVQMTKQVLKNSLPYLCIWALQPSALIGYMPEYWPLFCGSNFLSLVSIYLTTGAPEVAFQSIFQYLLCHPSAALAAGLDLTALTDSSALLTSSSNILWRFLTFYFTFAVGAVTFLAYRGPKENRKKETPSSPKATLFDFEVVNLDVSSKADGKTRDFVRNISLEASGSEAPLLSEGEVQESFRRLKADLEWRDENASQPDRITANRESGVDLEEGKHRLAKAFEEEEELSKRLAMDEEIALEAKKGYEANQAYEASLQRKKEIRRKAREDRKRKKEEARKAKAFERSRKKLLKEEPAGTTVVRTEDDQIRICLPDIQMEKTKTTSEEEERERKEEKSSGGKDVDD